MESTGFVNLMPLRNKTKQKTEFGDFQTPLELAREVCSLLSQQGLKPSSILEPTCGKGNFIVAALDYFPSAHKAIGIEINPDYVTAARALLRKLPNVRVMHKNFFTLDWKNILKYLADPLLIIGNPPWVTSAELGTLGSSNLPQKSNFQNFRGIDAITGKGNFDISEWMLIQAIEWLDGREATLAMLCKTAVARKVLLHAWKKGQHIKRSDIYQIDASRYFGAAVEGCLLVAGSSPSNQNFDCQTHDRITDGSPTTVFGYRQGCLVANVTAFERWKHLQGKEHYKWRSGIKHDCSRVMELRKENGVYRNRLDEVVDLEDDYLYPMLKSSHIANRPDRYLSLWMLVTQRFIGEDTSQIRDRAPKTWKYLLKHADFWIGAPALSTGTVLGFPYLVSATIHSRPGKSLFQDFIRGFISESLAPSEESRLSSTIHVIPLRAKQGKKPIMSLSF